MASSIHSYGDIYDPTRQQEVLYATQNIFLTSSSDIDIECCLIQIAKFNMGADKYYQHDINYIPPMMQISQSSALSSLVSSISSSVKFRINALKSSITNDQHSIHGSNNQHLKMTITLLSTHHLQLIHIEKQLNNSPKQLYLLLAEMITMLKSFQLEEYYSFS